MPRPVLIIREVEQLARRGKWRMEDLADILGVSMSMLHRLRAGTHTPSREVLARILRSFGGNPRVREFVLHFLEHEFLDEHAERLEALPHARDDFASLDPRARERVRGFVTHFLRRSLATGRGLRLVATDDQRLRTCVVAIVRLLDEHGISAVAVPANARVVAPSQQDAAHAAPLLVVERVEFTSHAVRALLTARVAVRKPLLLTSTCSAVDPALTPALAVCATVVLDAAPLPHPALPTPA